MSEFDFKITRDGALAHVDLNRPEEGNALTRAMMLRFAQVLREIGADSKVHVVTVGGRGGQFCRGRDGKGESRAGMTPYDVRVKMMGAVLDSYQAIRDVPVPVVALVHGDALGFGAALGKVHAKALTYLIYSAESLDAAAAVAAGLASKMLPQATFATDANAFLTTLAGRPRLVLETIKRYQAMAAHVTPDMASEYAGTLLALVRS